MKRDKKNIIIFLLLIGIIVAISADLFLVFNSKKMADKNNNKDSNNDYVSPPNSDYRSYNCSMNGESYTPYEDVKVYMYDIEGTIRLIYDKDKESYIVTGKENYKFVDPANYLGNVEKMKLFKNHEYERDDEHATIILDYEEFIEYTEISKYIEELKEVGYNCTIIDT